MAKKSKSTQPKPVQGRVVLGPSKGCPTIYANYAEVSHGEHDFSISFVEVPIRFSDEEKKAAVATGELHMEPSAQIIIAATLLPNLIAALNTQREKYEADFGKIRETGKVT